MTEVNGIGWIVVQCSGVEMVAGEEGLVPTHPLSKQLSYSYTNTNENTLSSHAATIWPTILNCDAAWKNIIATDQKTFSPTLSEIPMPESRRWCSRLPCFVFDIWMLKTTSEKWVALWWRTALDVLSLSCLMISSFIKSFWSVNSPLILLKVVVPWTLSLPYSWNVCG